MRVISQKVKFHKGTYVPCLYKPYLYRVKVQIPLINLHPVTVILPHNFLFITGKVCQNIPVSIYLKINLAMDSDKKLEKQLRNTMMAMAYPKTKIHIFSRCFP